MKILIVSNGNLEDICISDILEKHDLLICADGGARHLYKQNILPDIIVGDLDSIGDKVLNYYKKKEVVFHKFPSEKDKTDTELAIDYAIEKGATEISLLGVTGTRLDHTLANIMLLYDLLNKNIKARIIDSHNEIFMIKNNLEIQNDNKYKFVSVIPIINDAKKVNIKGFKYETKDIDFKIGTTLGISNEIKEEKGYIDMEDGICLIIKSRD
ncbi:thiamine diphosphokinase [Gottschalkia purinilytica]|uniref:Thiamine diphosphokinase n=1 Tax=Gottschalkia purinilytica TaxID=1503 RepID=A0A0L0WB42_GOTPU|nr:thiamine diphosphokinase [Gottschalkia purinilytica]KNF08749.1 thiamine diphosphokinase [Gottschalkia purinilytica]